MHKVHKVAADYLDNWFKETPNIADLVGMWTEQYYLQDGVHCLVKTSPAGQINGYIGVEHTHPWYNQDMDEVHIEVHRGLTFAGVIKTQLGDTGMFNPIWWFGFDTAHFGDVENYVSASAIPTMRYLRDEDYVRKEINRMVEQVNEAKK